VTVLRTWQQLADDELADDDAKHAFDRIHLDVCPGVLGSNLAGFLDPHGAAILTQALDLIEPPDSANVDAGVDGGGDAPRTLSQCRGEGLVKLAQFFLDRRQRAEAGADDGGSGDGSATRSGRAVANVDAVFTPQRDDLPFEHQRSEIVGFGPVPVSTITRLACDARAGWAVLDGRREVLDLGRRARTVSAAQRRAVVLRDEHCRHPGCRAPAAWCDVHHLVEWEHGGATDLANLVLLCRRHHVVVHEGRKRLVRDEASGEFRVERRPRGPSG